MVNQQKKLKKILIVDDDALIRKIIRFHLRDLYHLDEAENGEKAVMKSSQNSFDAILMDVSMKGMDGIEATKKIRTRLSYKNIPIVAVTGHTLESDRINIFAAGYSHMLPKPFDKRDLLNLLDDILR
jgi:two-component system, OmpR family, response regulator ResD